MKRPGQLVSLSGLQSSLTIGQYIHIMAPVVPYTINVPAEQLQLVRDKLAIATFPAAVDFSDDWNYGAPLTDIKRLAHRWAYGFDWRAQEARLNELPNYLTKVDVDGFGMLNIHFVHQRSDGHNSIPLLFCHGCKAASLIKASWHAD